MLLIDGECGLWVLGDSRKGTAWKGTDHQILSLPPVPSASLEEPLAGLREEAFISLLVVPSSQNVSLSRPGHMGAEAIASWFSG